jgi:hypothetical protein
VALLGKFFGNTVGQGAAFAIGASTARTLNPVLQSLANEAWTKHPDMPVDAGTLAAGVAQGQVPYQWAVDEAARTGISGDRFDHMVSIANTGPGVAEAFDLWRRGAIDEAGFRRAARRQGLEAEWIDDLTHVKNVLLDPSIIANAVQQGHVPNEDILPPAVTGSPPYHIPLTTIDLSPTDEAAGHGWTKERLQIATNLVGLPPGDIELLHMWNRGIIDEASVDAGIREGHRKTKWIPAVKQLRFAVLTAIQATNLHLRGWIDRPTMYAHGAKTGYTPELMDLLFKGQGRPLSWHQVWIGLQRGGTYDGPTGQIDDAFLLALKQSSIRPEWFNLAWAQRYTYPSAFVLRALTGDGTFTAAQTETALVDMGWRPDWAKQAATKWAGGGGTTTDSHVSKAQTQLWSAIHSSYLAGDATDNVALQKLGQAGVSATTAPLVLALWKHEREVVRQRLTPAQVKAAVKKGVNNEATGAPWTRDDALAELLSRGWSSGDANTFLDE